MELPSPEVCWQALATRDARFDGRLFVGVRTTGIYCRPICPARTPKPAHCEFFRSAAAAQEAGYRPCLRCRPEVAPDHGAWHGTSATVARGLQLVAEGALDGDHTVDDLAARLGIGERQLRRLFQRHLGASPLAIAQTRRVLFAKQLVHDTRLPMGEIAIAAGFGSVRRFNETFRALFGRPPSELRRRTVEALPEGSVAGVGVAVRLPYRPPYDWDAMLGYFEERAIPGLESVTDGRYRRAVRLGDERGTIEVGHLPERAALIATIRFPSVRALGALTARVRRVFDVSADAAAIAHHLGQDALLGPLIAARPGLRAPGGWDGFELAVRAILGQQVSVRAARNLVATLVERWGARLDDPWLSRVFPTPAELLAADLGPLGMPGARKAALAAVAEAALADPTLFEPLGTVEETVARLRAIRGVGEWTAQYIALRAAREPDAFPASDVGLLRGAAADGARPTPAELAARAEPWRPWRAYAAQHLWAADAARREVVGG